jgi:hypothetical protein
MPAEARITPVWKKTRLAMAVIFLGYGLYFYFDGWIGYPRSNERWTKHHEFEQAGKLDEWKAFAASKGWVAEPPHKFYERKDIIGQFAFGSLCCIGGLVALAYWFSQVKRIVRTDDEAVYSPSGTRVPFGSIAGIGLKKWDSKGLATVRYQIDGRTGEFVLDDYKFDPDATKQIVEEIKARLEARAESSAA